MISPVAAFRSRVPTGTSRVMSGALLTGLVCPQPVLAARRSVVLLVLKIQKGRQMPVGAHQNRPAVPAVSAIGPSFGHELLAAEADASLHLRGRP